jgi:recombinational DNA repair protein (RecF pathway)
MGKQMSATTMSVEAVLNKLGVVPRLNRCCGCGHDLVSQFMP